MPLLFPPVRRRSPLSGVRGVGFGRPFARVATPIGRHVVPRPSDQPLHVVGNVLTRDTRLADRAARGSRDGEALLRVFGVRQRPYWDGFATALDTFTSELELD